jgi:translation initiation factor 2B subunit (eIF-2B alpha/beta/delta family)
MQFFSIPDKYNHILDDRESGSVALLNRLLDALENELQGADLRMEDFSFLIRTIREKLNHFAAIENFLASLAAHSGQRADFPGEALRFIADYRLYWQDSAAKIARNFLQHCHPEDHTILTHSQSETVISVLNQLHLRQVPFRVLQTVSFPGEEGRLSYERMCQLNFKAELIPDHSVEEALAYTDLILMACDALLTTEFLNKTGTQSILRQAKHLNKRTFLLTESRKEITRTGWKQGLTGQALFEWVPLSLVDWVVTER